MEGIVTLPYAIGGSFDGAYVHVRVHVLQILLFRKELCFLFGHSLEFVNGEGKENGIELDTIYRTNFETKIYLNNPLFFSLSHSLSHKS